LPGRASAARGVVDPRVCIVTHEQRPLELLGATGSEATARLLGRAGVEVVTGADPRATFDGVLQSATGALLKAGRAVTLPALAGRPPPRPCGIRPRRWRPGSRRASSSAGPARNSSNPPGGVMAALAAEELRRIDASCRVEIACHVRAALAGTVGGT
jgi:hypothetical protein